MNYPDYSDPMAWQYGRSSMRYQKPGQWAPDYYDYLYGQYHIQEAVPFTSMYPMPDMMMQEQEYDKDFEYLKSLYPQQAKKIQKAVEDECDKMEYEGSLMFDDYPDKMMLEKVTMRIYDKVKDPEMEMEMEATAEDSVEAKQWGPYGSSRGGSSCRGWHCDFIKVMLFQEMHQRRCRHKRCRRWW